MGCPVPMFPGRSNELQVSGKLQIAPDTLERESVCFVVSGDIPDDLHLSWKLKPEAPALLA